MFVSLLEHEREIIDNDGWNILMTICRYKPNLINHERVLELVYLHCGK